MPEDMSDRIAFASVKPLHFIADRFFAERYDHRVVGYFEEEAVTSYTHFLERLIPVFRRTYRRRRLPSITGTLRPMPPCATWSLSSTRMKPGTGIATTASLTRSSAEIARSAPVPLLLVIHVMIFAKPLKGDTIYENAT